MQPSKESELLRWMMLAYPSVKNRQAVRLNASVGVSHGKSNGGERTTSDCCLNDMTSVLNTGNTMMKQTTMAEMFAAICPALLRAL